jgi:RNA polymerase sigma-70 factor, ECF subfamily
VCNPTSSGKVSFAVPTSVSESRVTDEAALDGVLVRRTRAGDPTAFEELVVRHHGVVARVVARIVGDNDADDVTQDAFLRAFHRLGNFRGEASFRTWLLRIAHNSAYDTLERRRREQALADLDDEETLEPAPPARAPADRLEAKERQERLQTKLRLLTPAHRAVVVLRDLEGLTYDEIATVTNTPVGSVKGRLHRARRELIALLRANTYDWELPDG